MIYSLIISAGKQHRFNSETPKALADINGQSLLDININHALKHSDKVIIVASYENSHFFQNYKKENVDIIEIESGYGCGDAIWQSLRKLNLTTDDYVYLMWGDSIQNDDELFENCKSISDYVVIPVVKEESPYVQIVADSSGYIIGSKFSKYNEDIDKNSFHDLSLFYANGVAMTNILNVLHNILWDVEKQHYICKHGDEMTFLDIFNYSDCFNKNTYNLKENKPKILEVQVNNTFSFNTIDELENIKNNLKNKC